MNKKCYCTDPLESANRKAGSPEKVICTNCYRDVLGNEKEVFACFNENCIYLKLRNALYVVCSDCYAEQNDDIKHDQDKSNEMKFILSKFPCSINSIS